MLDVVSFMGQHLVRAASCVVLAIIISVNASASVGDFTLHYAIDAIGVTDAGKIACSYVRSCEIRAPGLGMRLVIDVDKPDHGSFELRIYGPNGCCYSADAGGVFYLPIEPGLRKLPIYAGRMRQRNEFIINERFGVLYLEFSDIH